MHFLIQKCTNISNGMFSHIFRVIDFRRLFNSKKVKLSLKKLSDQFDLVLNKYTDFVCFHEKKNIMIIIIIII